MKIGVSGLLVILAVAVAAAGPARSATSFDDIVNAARKEGKLHIWYGSPSEEKTWSALRQAFEKRFDLKVNLTRTFLYSTRQPPRIAAEARAGVLNADVVMVTLSKPEIDLQNQLGVFEVTDWVALFGEAWPGIKEVMEFDPKPIRGWGLSAMDFLRGIVYNTRMVSREEVPGTIEGFADPKWNRKIVFGDANLEPLTRISGHPDWTLERSVRVGKALLANNPIFARTSVMATDMVARGEGAVFLHSSWASYEKRRREAAPIGFKPFSDFVIVHGISWAPLKAAPNPNMARLFVAWYAMEGGQIAEKMEGYSSVIQPGTEKKKLFDELRKGRRVVTEESIEDVEKRAKFDSALRKLVTR